MLYENAIYQKKKNSGFRRLRLWISIRSCCGHKRLMMQLEWNFVQLFTSRSITYVQEVAVEALDFSTRTLRVTKVRNGEEESFEYCELLVQISSSRQIRAIIYRTPHSEDHRVRKGAFLSEFSSFMESIILSKDHLLILGDLVSV